MSLMNDNPDGGIRPVDGENSEGLSEAQEAGCGRGEQNGNQDGASDGMKMGEANKPLPSIMKFSQFLPLCHLHRPGSCFDP